MNSCFNTVAKFIVWPMVVIGIGWFTFHDIVADNALSLLSIVGWVLVVALRILFWSEPSLPTSNINHMNFDPKRRK